MGVKVDGHEQVGRWLTDAGGKIDKGSIAVLRRAAVRVRRRQKELAPKKSGDLQRSIRYRIRGSRWRRVAHIGPTMDEPYPLFQEIGTSRMAANPYVEPSLQGEDGRIADDLNRLIGGLR